MHYINNLRTHSCTINGIQTADRDEIQIVFCSGAEINKKDGVTSLGKGVDCVACIEKYRAELYQPLKCKKCNVFLDMESIQQLSPMDE